MVYCGSNVVHYTVLCDYKLIFKNILLMQSESFSVIPFLIVFIMTGTGGDLGGR